MQLGLVGLGRMGFNMRERLRAAGHDVVGYDRNQDVSDVASIAEMVEKLNAPRIVWIMVPHGEPTKQTVRELAGLLSAGDLVIEGGNSKYTDDQENAALLAENGIKYVDVGVSGGVWGAKNGYGLMAGGDAEDVERAMPIFDALRPEGPREEGFVHAGPVGAGHYAKMIHNGIEYGLMQAYAEGLAVLHRRDDLVADPAQVARIWCDGSVIRSWLLELSADALEADPGLSAIAPYVADSGEGRWTVAEALELDVPAPVITQAMIARLRSRDAEGFGDRVVAALRDAFGGHGTRPG